MFGEVLNATVSSFFRWLDLLIFGGAIVLYGYLIGLLVQRALLSTASDAILGVVIIVLLQVILVAGGQAVMMTSLTRIILQRLRGEHAPLSDAFGGLLDDAGLTQRYVLVYAVISFIIAAVYVFLLFGPEALAAAATFAGNPTAVLQQTVSTPSAGPTCFIVMFFLAAMFMWAAMNALAYPVIAAERLGGMAAIWRSYELVKQSWGVFFGAILVSIVLIFALGFLTAPLLQSLVNGRDSNSALLIFTIWVLVIGMLSTVSSSIFSAVWYRAVVAKLELTSSYRDPVVRGL